MFRPPCHLRRSRPRPAHTAPARNATNASVQPTTKPTITAPTAPPPNRAPGSPTFACGRPGQPAAPPARPVAPRAHRLRRAPTWRPPTKTPRTGATNSVALCGCSRGPRLPFWQRRTHLSVSLERFAGARALERPRGRRWSARPGGVWGGARAHERTAQDPFGDSLKRFGEALQRLRARAKTG